MEKNRLKLQEYLEQFTDNVYYQPPSDVHLEYPCIIYDISNINDDFANDNPYMVTYRWTLNVLTISPNDPIIAKIKMNAKYIKFDRHYKTDGVNHTVYTLNY